MQITLQLGGPDVQRQLLADQMKLWGQVVREHNIKSDLHNPFPLSPTSPNDFARATSIKQKPFFAPRTRIGFKPSRLT